MDILFPLYIKSYPILSIMEQVVSYHSQILGEWRLELQILATRLHITLPPLLLPLSLFTSHPRSPVPLGLHLKASLFPVSLSCPLFSDGPLPTDAHSCSTEVRWTRVTVRVSGCAQGYCVLSYRDTSRHSTSPLGLT